MKEYPWGKGTPTWTRDATANDSDKSFTVPAGKVWNLLAVTAELAATATVGSRVLRAYLKDSSADYLAACASVTITANQIGTMFWEYGFGSTSTTIRRGPNNGSPNVTISQNLHPCILPAGYSVRVIDTAAIVAAADDMVVVLHYVEYDA